MVLWSNYFDSGLTKSQGRRTPLSLSVHSPKAEEIFHLCKKLGLSPELQDEKRHPSSDMEKMGRILVRSKKKKTIVIKEIAKGLLKQKKK
ncbi:MAG: signal recognition particle subunit SRP19/SEC65 family protein [Candidatus Thermoplasmatota archaeon]|nr:signal recognition particle subunit SRP19/SEC65 family protein [Candidatus Thermoplasmatota archaeon]